MSRATSQVLGVVATAGIGVGILLSLRELLTGMLERAFLAGLVGAAVGTLLLWFRSVRG